MREDSAIATELAEIGAFLGVHDPIQWKVKTKLEKRIGDWNDENFHLAPEPFEIIEKEGNLLIYGGASCLWQCLIGNGTGTAAQTLTFFNNGNAYIGTGDSTTAAQLM